MRKCATKVGSYYSHWSLTQFEPAVVGLYIILISNSRVCKRFSTEKTVKWNAPINFPSFIILDKHRKCQQLNKFDAGLNLKSPSLRPQVFGVKNMLFPKLKMYVSFLFNRVLSLWNMFMVYCCTLNQSLSNKVLRCTLLKTISR